MRNQEARREEFLEKLEKAEAKRLKKENLEIAKNIEKDDKNRIKEEEEEARERGVGTCIPGSRWRRREKNGGGARWS